MQVTRHNGNIYMFRVQVCGPSVRRTLNGLVDTGSTFCACTYKVITALKARPVDYRTVHAVNCSPELRLIYSLNVGFDKRHIKTEVVRVTSMPDGFDFILGMSVLRHCDLTLNSTGMVIVWRPV